MSNNQGSYRIINNQNQKYNTLRNQTSQILSKINKISNDHDQKIKQDQVLKQIIKDNYNKKIKKHSYSSL